MEPLKDSRDLLGVGIYSLPQAARLLSFSAKYRVSPKKIRRWMFGYKWGFNRYSSGIVTPEIQIDHMSLLSFADFIEMLYVAAFRREGVLLPVIRAAHARAAERLKHPHPFSHYTFFTNGKRIFHELTREEIGSEVPANRVVEEVERSQIVFNQVVEPFCKNVDYVKDVAAQYWPLGRERCVVLNPKRSFGRPIDPRSGVPTNVLFAAHQSGDPHDLIEMSYEVSDKSLSDAIQYEEGLLKAA